MKVVDFRLNIIKKCTRSFNSRLGGKKSGKMGGKMGEKKADPREAAKRRSLEHHVMPRGFRI
jgi:hypothetical protein